MSRGLDEFVVDVVGPRGHLLCLRRVSADVDPRDEGAQANTGGVLLRGPASERPRTGDVLGVRMAHGELPVRFPALKVKEDR
jgi:hypothetical protein